MKRRGLSSSDKELWDRVTASATPLHAKTAAPDVGQKPLPRNPKKAKSSTRIPDFEIGGNSKLTNIKNDLAPALSERLNAQPLRMDGKAYGRMKQGKLKPDAKLDLHGLTLADAHPTLVRFVMEGYARGLRLLLVVTGKGKHRDDDGPIPQPRGVLRHQVPQWLTAPPLGARVLQVTEAHLRHGGSGAYYVYLRRAR